MYSYRYRETLPRVGAFVQYVNYVENLELRAAQRNNTLNCWIDKWEYNALN